MNVPSRAGTMMDEAGSSIFPADDPVSTPPIPRWCNGSTPVFGTVRRGSNPRRGATPIPLRNAQSLFRFGVKAIRNFEVNLSPQWTPYGARCSVNGFSPLLFPVAPEQPSRAKERRPPSTVRKGTPPAIEANRVGNGLQNRAWLGSTPAIASHRIRISGTDTCRRSCRASPSAKVHLTSESAELRTRV